RCSECGNWNTYVEEQVRTQPAHTGKSTARSVSSGARALALKEVQFAQANRLRLGIRELNQVLGGGIVPGSLVLVGGDPGIGKSTLLLQLSHDVAQTFGPVLYVSGEESVQQLKLRADRLGIGGDRLLVLAENDLDAIVEQVTQIHPTLAVIDSIQTVFMESVSSAPGSVSQVREVLDPSRAFLEDRSLQEVGNVVHVALEGTRPLLVELQSLVTDAAYGTPRRSVTGIDLNRLHMLAAVLEKRAGVSLGGRD